MTGAALTGRLGIIPTLGRIIRVYDPSRRTKQALHSGEKGNVEGSGLGGNQLTTPIVPNLPSRDNARAVSGSRRRPRVRNLSLDLTGS